MKTQTTIRIEEKNYHKAKEILDQMGMNYSQAIGVFNSLVVMNNGLPFDVKIPNNIIENTLQDPKEIESEILPPLPSLFDVLDTI
ncbi:MAG: type II toxin-antitoxin system RelB/DinJ family antitoxin [Sulfurovum sp.]|nr:type II toxin-antitoxin system RelB/DinJ family antitoxin [Sulfurovum sp.]